MITLKQGNQNPQNNMIASFSFALMYKCSNQLPQRAEILTQRSNSTPQLAKNTERFACGTEVAFDIKRVTVTSHLPLFSPETSKLQLTVYSEWKHLCLKLLHEEGLDR